VALSLNSFFFKDVLFFVVLIGLFLFSEKTLGQQTYTAVSNSGWTNPASWSPPANPAGPLITDNVVIGINFNVSANTTINDITISAGNTFIQNNNTTLTINGTLTMGSATGAGNIIGQTGGLNRNVQLKGNFLVAAGTDCGTTPFNFLNVSQTASKNFTINGTFYGNVSTGFTMSLANIIIGATGAWKPIANTIVPCTSLTITDGGIIDNVRTGGISTTQFNVNAGAPGALSTVGDCVLNINGPTSISGTLNFSKTGSVSKTFNGTITNNQRGEFRNIVGESLFLNCDIVNNSVWTTPLVNTGTYTVSGGNYTYSGTNLIGMSQLTLTGGSTVTNLGLLSLSGTSGLTVNASGSFTNGNGSYLQILTSGTGITSAGTINFATPSNEVDYGYSGNQNVYPTNYSKLTASTSGTKSLTGTTDVSSTLKTSSSAILDAGTNVLSGSGNIIMSETSQINFAETGVTIPRLTGSSNSFAAGTTIRLYGTATQSLGSSTTFPYQNLLVNGTTSMTSVVDLSNVNSIAGNLTIANAARFTSNPLLMVGGTTTYSTTGSSILTSALTTGSFGISAGSVQLNANIIINGNNGELNITGGTLSFLSTKVISFITGTGQKITGIAGSANLEINNDVTLVASSISIINSLILTSGRLITGLNKVSISNGGTVTQTSGFVEGNLEKYIGTCTNCLVLFEVGTGTTSAPLKLTHITVTVAGFMTGSTVAGDSPNISLSQINSSKSVNRYWKLTNPSSSGVTFTNYIPDFTYNSSEVDGGASVSTFNYSRFNTSASTWSTPEASNGSTTSTNFVASLTVNNPVSGASREFQIGTVIQTTSFINRVTGNSSWNSASTWLQSRTGTISYSSGTFIVTGNSTSFLTEISPNDIIGLSNGTIVGTVSSVDSDTQITLFAKPSSSSPGTFFGRERIPSSTDAVQIGNGNLPAVATNIQLDSDGSCYSLTFNVLSTAQSLTHISKTLMVGSTVILNPGSSATNSWNINDGSASTTTLTIGDGSGVNASSKIAQVVLTSGTLTVASNITFIPNNSVKAESTTILDMSGGASRLNFGGAFIFSNGRGLLKSSASSSVNFNSSLVAQSILIPANDPTNPFVYNNILANNTSTTGLTLPTTSLINSNFTGDLKVQSGSFTALTSITGSVGKIFQISPGASFVTSGGIVTPLAGFGSYDLGTSAPFGNFTYSLLNGLTVLSASYGNLNLTTTQTYQFPSGTTSISGALTLSGNSTLSANAGAVITVDKDVNVILGTINLNTASIKVGGDWNNNATFNQSTGTVTFTGAGGTLQSITGSSNDTFYNLTINTGASSTVQLLKNVTVSNILSLTAGWLDINGKTLNITNSNLSGITRSSGYIKSEKTAYPYSSVTWTTSNSTGAYIFPFAKSSGEYIPFTCNITIAGTTGGTMSVATYGTSADNKPYPNGVLWVSQGKDDISQDVVDRFWIVTPSGNTINPTATLTFRTITSEVGLILNPVAQRWSTGGFWDASLGQTYTAPDMIVVPGVSNYGVWALAGNASVLPIELVDWQAKVRNSNQVHLAWSSLSEINSDHFEIERSHNGIDFVNIASVPSSGNSKSRIDYGYIDMPAITGKYYYRLVQIDFDGKNKVFGTIGVTIGSDHFKNFDITPSPNPVTDQSRIQLPLMSEETEFIIRLFNSSGKLILTEQIKNNQSFFNIDRNTLPSGLIFIQLISGSNQWSSRFLVSE
jgi:hypothetical protein